MGSHAGAHQRLHGEDDGAGGAPLQCGRRGGAGGKVATGNVAGVTVHFRGGEPGWPAAAMATSV